MERRTFWTILAALALLRLALMATVPVFEPSEARYAAISANMARRMAPFVDGYFLITPFSRTELMVRIMERIRSDALE